MSRVVPLRRRISGGMRRPANWLQLGRFATVGASGYVVNLLVFAGVDGAGAGHRLAAVAAFGVAVANNFWWNRVWTFAAREGRATFQAARFLVVSLSAFAFAFVVLEVLVVVVEIPALAAQAIAIVCATPLNFLGNRLWSFRR